MNNKNNKTVINPVVAGAAGAVMGAGIAVAAYQTLKEEKTRTKVKQGISKVKDETIDYVNELSSKPNKLESQKNIKKLTKQKKQ